MWLAESVTETPRTGPATRRTADAGRFARVSGRNRFTARPATVTRVQRIAPALIRVTVTGPDFADFPHAGPADHVKVFFPDAATGELIAPVAAGPGEDGIVRPDRASIGRDYTPIVRRSGDDVELDLDFFVHADPGPASAWAESAQPGDEIVVVGPRGSKRAPQAVDGAILVCDESSLPSVSQWIRDLPSGCTIDVIAAVAGDPAWVADYLGERSDVTLRIRHAGTTGAAWLPALRAIGPIDDGTFVWAAGDASELVAVRRYLRRELGLPAVQAVANGYWRPGVAAFDHHAPIDPTDPD